MKLLLILLILFCSSAEKKIFPELENFTPIEDGALAKKYLPIILDSKEFGNPVEVLYRASKDKDGKIFITYHFAWEKEENLTSGFSPFLSRNIYTGGLSLQKTMFGKKDIELVSLEIEKDKITSLEFETAENYDPKKFGVKHKHLTIKEGISTPICFKVKSWNHLFEEKPIFSCSEKQNLAEVNYFTEKLWTEYTMTKEKEGFFSRNRAHKIYEREFVR